MLEKLRKRQVKQSPPGLIQKGLPLPGRTGALIGGTDGTSTRQVGTTNGGQILMSATPLRRSLIDLSSPVGVEKLLQTPMTPTFSQRLFRVCSHGELGVRKR